MSRMSAIGSYSRNDYSGLGADDSKLPFADQTLIGIVQAQPQVIYTEWAEQTGDVTWNEVVPTTNYQAYAITDTQLIAVVKTTSTEVEDIAVVSPTLTFASQVEKAFEGTPYEYLKTEAVYAQLDAGSPPAIYFVYWLKLRPATDAAFGNGSLNNAATSVGGILSYLLPVPTTGSDRARPATSFTQALALQAAKTPITIPSTPAVVTTQASAPSTSGDTVTALLLVGLGVGAAIGGYKLVQHYRGK